MPITAEEKVTLATIERVASCFSLVGTMFIFVTFLSSSEFRKPVNRLVFYASWGNILCNIATLISESGISAGQSSPLCSFQAFLIQMFVPADAFWNFAMAFNVYLTIFRNYNAHQLKKLEWRYHALCYGTPFVVAFVLLFAETKGKGKIYGDAILWCWIAKPYSVLRVALCYGPAWFCIVTALTIYLTAGFKIFSKRRELRAFQEQPNIESWENFKTTQIAVTSELKEPLPITRIEDNFAGTPIRLESISKIPRRQSFDQYSVKICAQRKGSQPSVATQMLSQQSRKNRAAMEANRAAWGYTKVAILFFISLLVTWVPSSANRLYALAHPEKFSISLAYVAGLVLSLMGFWNSVIYIVTSRAACKTLFLRLFVSRGYDGGMRQRRNIQDSNLPRRLSASAAAARSWEEEDLERLAPVQPKRCG